MLHTLSVRRAKGGFTLIELLVVTLILSILMAVALPLYLSSIADAKKKTCRANMQTIANAVQAARVKATATDYSAYIGKTVDATLLPDLPSAPHCPNNGTYTIEAASTTTNVGGYQVNCSFTSDGHFEPGVDNN